MDRRAFIDALAGGLLAAPLVAEAQQAGRASKIGIIYLNAPVPPSAANPFWQHMEELGWSEGKNLIVERRGAAEVWDRIPALTAELVNLKVDLIIVSAGAMARSVQQATRTVPMCVVAGDFQAEGLVVNLARPDTNVTGVQLVQPDLAGKRLGLLKEILPALTRVGILIPSRSPTMAAVLQAAEGAGTRIGLTLKVVESAGPTDFDAAFSLLTKERVQGLLVVSGPGLLNHRSQLVAAAAKNRLAAIYDYPTWAAAGGLMSYGPTESEINRRWADCVDKILRGASPAAVPVQQPTKFELAVNLKTAKALGLTIPSSLH
jgi:putative ABC transport system substrate-binding protein